ncbi:basement membrane-specific heparan sulfate proteoglycan core protein isoform X4 [Denticeps clupeoides]|uniref:basement membrane-specific heparan sulfate proteoglycan core protein isoform X4 n=1 Tax=Denticeps clupeoides TaxID=299321 RepID=UPI0010A58C30|nr:basement membrane-specific heparan sulfate proteoglycan core protein isoform X4 [Denticeps clupeoides]
MDTYRIGTLFVTLVLTSQVSSVSQSSKVWGEVPIPEDLEARSGPTQLQHYLNDDEDFAADGSAELPSGEEDGSTPDPGLAGPTTIYYRALVNFTNSFDFSPDLESISSPQFQYISDAVVDTLESEYGKVPGSQTVNVVLIKQVGKNVFVELDVGTEDNYNDAQIRSVLFGIVKEGTIASYVTSTQGFQFRRLGEVVTIQSEGPVPITVAPDSNRRPCLQDEFTCQDGSCIPLQYHCDQRPDCLDMSDELGCEAAPPPVPATRRPAGPGPCRADQATCRSGECISRDYLCDGERDCSDGSDEITCGTPSPCEPNEFKCANGRCALKLWRCDGDNDCQDNSDELNCPTKAPGDTCAPEQFMCLSDRTCIPASYQCDEEPDCPDRSDEYGCVPPTVTSPPAESITAARGQTITFTCVAVGTPTPIITWRLNWGHIPLSARITMKSVNGHGTLTIRDVKEADQGAYTCEAINAKGLVFAIPDGVLTLSHGTVLSSSLYLLPGSCADGHFRVEGRCLSCFCFGITKNCQSTERHRNQITLRFTDEDDFKGVNVSYPSGPSSPPPLTATQLLINPEEGEFQLVDLSRRFLSLDSYWTLPRQFLGNKIDSYGGSLKFKIRYTVARGQMDSVEKPDVVLVGNGQRIVYHNTGFTAPREVNQKEVHFTEDNWQHSSGRAVTREDLMMTLANLQSISIRTIYDNHMVSVALSDIIMDTTTVEYSLQGAAKDVEECRCPPGYSGLSCETCASGFERVSGGAFLGTCAGCHCNGHASACDPISGHCLSCQHHTEGQQCEKCRPGYFGDPRRGRPDDCKPCPCPYIDTSRRFSDTCFLDHDSQPICDACKLGYTGRRCERCASGYIGNPLEPNGKCVLSDTSRCDNRGTVTSGGRQCNCKANVVGALCDECQSGSFHLSRENPEGCLRCFCMGVTKQCASSTWTRDQVRGDVNGQLFSLANRALTRTITDGVSQRGFAEVVFRAFTTLPSDIYFWVLPENFRGDKVTAYGGELQYTVRYEPRSRSLVIDGQPDVVLQGNGIFLEHHSQSKALPRVPTTIRVSFRESAWRRADGQPCTREHLLMALSDITVFMIRATYADNMAESSLSDIQMDIAIPHSTGNERALEVEECACPQGYKGPSCQECDHGYTRTGSGLYLGTCERCNCHGHSSSCDPDTRECLDCEHNTIGPHCAQCRPGFYGNPASGSPSACQPCPCVRVSSDIHTCHLDSDGRPTCKCPVGYAGRQCERCASGYTGNPQLSQTCTLDNTLNGNCHNCDKRGSEGCSANNICRCKTHVEGPFCSSCKSNYFHISASNRDGCLSCFCMGVVQTCSSSDYYRDVISTSFSHGNFQGFTLVNRQGSISISSGFSVEVSSNVNQLSYSKFDNLSQEPYYWQMPAVYKGDKSLADEEHLLDDDQIWKRLSSSIRRHSASSISSPSSHSSSSSYGPSPPSDLASSPIHPMSPGPAHDSAQYALVYKDFGSQPSQLLYWCLPKKFSGDKVSSYGGKLKYTISYVAGSRGTSIQDVDVQIIGNDITLVTRHLWQKGQGTRETRHFEIVFREENWQRPDGMPATREHLLMALADLEDILIRASYHTELLSSSISHVSMEVAVPNYTGLAGAPEVEQCLCPPGYSGLSCQDCAPGYTRTGFGLYLGNCEPCDCNGHSDTCDPEKGTCTSCQHHTVGDQCQSCAPFFFGDPTAGTPEDCQPCACPHPEREYQFSPVCESLGNGGYRCTACQTGYTGQYCERCAPGFSGNPQERVKCRPDGSDSASLVVRIHPERVQVSEGGPLSLRCYMSGLAPHHYYWSRQDGRPISIHAERRRQGEELFFSSVQLADAGVYICTGRDQHHTNRSRAEVIVTASSMKPIEVFIEEPNAQTLKAGSSVSFICTAKSKFPAYTLVWTRQGSGKLPSRAMDFNGILTIHNVQPEDSGRYVCTGSNMFAMDEGTATLYVTDTPQTSQMFYTAYEMFEGHRKLGEGAQPVATVQTPVLTVQQGQQAEFRCSAAGNPVPDVMWIGGSGRVITQGGVLKIPAVARSDEGEYICRAQNIHGEHTARAVLYVHAGAGFPQVHVSPQQTELHEGQTLHLYCRAEGTPSPALTWKKRGGDIPQQAIPFHGFHQFKSNSLDVLQKHVEELQVDRTDTGTLLIPNIRLIDSGTYLCVATNTVGSSEAPIKVTVVRASSGINIQPYNATVQEGGTLDLQCMIPGDAQHRVTWRRANGFLASNHQVIGTRLRILHASAADSGDYICQVEESSEMLQTSVSVTIAASRLQTPIISITPHSAVVKRGESASFTCVLYSGAQPVRLEWKLSNNQPLPENVNVAPDGSVITIKSAVAQNKGTYRCVASNLYGITQSFASLIVRESPQVSVTKGPVRVRAGDPINLECQASGEPYPSVSWHRLDASRRTVLSSPLPMESNAVMQILVARPEDRGIYVCKAQNNQGTTESQVEVIVEGQSQVPAAPFASVPEPLMVVEEGQNAILRCSASGLPIPTISWSKLRSPLPWRHKVVNGSLVLPSVGRQDSGQYICNASNHMGISEVTIMLDVETPPYATSLSDVVEVRVGEVIRIQCLAHGTPPLHFEWSKLNSTLPVRAEVSGGDLQINLASPEDTGTYKCVVTNKVGQSETQAKVAVHSPLSVRVSPQVEVRARGGAVEFTCVARGDEDITIDWLKEGGALPHNHHIRHGVLRIENLEQNNEGIYICRATSPYGQAQDSAKLSIQALPKVMINVRTSVQTVMVGTTVEFECQAEGTPQPSLHWSKVAGTMPTHITVKGGMLTISPVVESDAGQYRCTATNDVGSVQSQVVLNVQSLPQIAAHPETKEVTVGSEAVLPCVVTGYPTPNITWSKLDSEVPEKCFQDAHQLTVPSVTHEDAGTYVCTAANKQGKVQAFTKLHVHERVMPYFIQDPLSYLTLPTIKNAYKAFNIKITFRPDNVDGMIIFNGQKKTTGADFISLGLVGGRPEFRFDVGSGMATIRSPASVTLGAFHTVELRRNLTSGSLIMDGQPPITGSSQGKFHGLDLNEVLYVGGYPNYTLLAQTAGLNTGFVGCIRQLVIQGEEVIFKNLDRSSTGVTNCPTCKDNPCQNGGYCQDSETSLYKCSCPRGFKGSNCQHHASLHCHPEACGPDATCISRSTGLGYDCRCHLGKSGEKCMDGMLVTTPWFVRSDSYIAYPPLTNIHNDLRIDMEFKPTAADGLMFFSGGKKMKTEDFVALSMVGGYVEFRYELGTGQAVLHSPLPVSLGQWHRVEAGRLNQDGSLRVDAGLEVLRSSPGKAQGLNIHTPMFLGGVPSMDILPKPANVSALFDGCIGEVSINGKTLDLSYSFTESHGIRQCRDSSPCDRRPCLNQGQCLTTAEFEYQCVCRDGYEGDRCETVKEVCEGSSQCQNGGRCLNNRCVCMTGYSGIFCEEGSVLKAEADWSVESSMGNDAPVQYSVYFHDDGYLALPKLMFPRSSSDAPETIEVEIQTTSKEGLILWQGVEPITSKNRLHAGRQVPRIQAQTRMPERGHQGKGKDFISLGLQNGHAVFSYQLGSGEARITSKGPINDGSWHKITAFRTGKQGNLQIDGGPISRGQSMGNSIMVNTKGSIYLGGAPDVKTLSGGKFSSGITGCIRNLLLMNTRPGHLPHTPINLQVHAEDGQNVERCSL